MTTAIVLGGGGAHGDFEVGAVRYLYDRGLYPQLICGTSVGAINGAALAEGGDYVDEGTACYVHAAPTGVNDTELFRLVNPSSGDHFYTTSEAERVNAMEHGGYAYEMVAGYVLTAPTGVGDSELFRLVNPATGDHFYTTSGAERVNAVEHGGYSYEMVACYVLTVQVPGTVPLYRMLNPRNGDHFYTTSTAERDRALHMAALEKLERIWLDMESERDMYWEEPWLATINNSRLKKFLQQSLAQGVGAVAGEVATGVLFPPMVLHDAMQAGIDIVQLGVAVDAALTAKSFYNLRPIEEKLNDHSRLDPEKVRRSGIKLRMAVVGLESGTLRYVNESGQILVPARMGDHLYTTSALERDMAVATYGYRAEGIACYVYAAPTGVRDSELFRLVNASTGDHFYTASNSERSNAIDHGGYTYETVAGYVLTTPTGVGDSEFFQLRNPRTGDHFYTTSSAELGNAVDHGGYIYQMVACYVLTVQLPGTIPLYRLVKITDTRDVGLIKGVMASASIPVVFPPVKLLDEWYVDGGVRDILPIRAAVDSGAAQIFGILATKATIRDDETYDLAGTRRIGQRAVDIMCDEIQQDESNPPRGWSVPITVIQPTVDVHDTMTIVQADISMSMAYGFMRAADVIGVPPDHRARCTALADEIVVLRKAILAAETYARTPNVTFDPHAQDELRQVRRMKRQLKSLVDERRASGGVGSVPADAQSWWQQWERRPDPPFMATPWDAVMGDHGVVLVDAEPAP